MKLFHIALPLFAVKLALGLKETTTDHNPASKTWSADVDGLGTFKVTKGDDGLVDYCFYPDGEQESTEGKELTLSWKDRNDEPLSLVFNGCTHGQVKGGAVIDFWDRVEKGIDMDPLCSITVEGASQKDYDIGAFTESTETTTHGSRSTDDESEENRSWLFTVPDILSLEVTELQDQGQFCFNLINTELPHDQGTWSISKDAPGSAFFSSMGYGAHNMDLIPGACVKHAIDPFWMGFWGTLEQGQALEEGWSIHYSVLTAGHLEVPFNYPIQDYTLITGKTTSHKREDDTHPSDKPGVRTWTSEIKVEDKVVGKFTAKEDEGEGHSRHFCLELSDKSKIPVMSAYPEDTWKLDGKPIDLAQGCTEVGPQDKGREAFWAGLEGRESQVDLKLQYNYDDNGQTGMALFSLGKFVEITADASKDATYSFEIKDVGKLEISKLASDQDEVEFCYNPGNVKTRGQWELSCPGIQAETKNHRATTTKGSGITLMPGAIQGSCTKGSLNDELVSKIWKRVTGDEDFNGDCTVENFEGTFDDPKGRGEGLGSSKESLGSYKLGLFTLSGTGSKGTDTTPADKQAGEVTRDGAWYTYEFIKASKVWVQANEVSEADGQKTYLGQVCLEDFRKQGLAWNFSCTPESKGAKGPPPSEPKYETVSAAAGAQCVELNGDYLTQAFGDELHANTNFNRRCFVAFVDANKKIIDPHSIYQFAKATEPLPASMKLVGET